ncbi:MAG: hypothetical protein EA402_08005 [Planctomycetota bacterium]|nr:MAG: hypothetical protein EA402_08005 [Planctomycetota bacterium]
MEPPMTCVAVIDIGKTNKKLCCFDERLELLDQVSAAFPTLPGEHGLLYEDVEGIWAWYQEQLPALYRRHPFSAIAVTTHGATYALLDAQGALAHPVVAYDSPLDGPAQRRLDEAFYQRCGPLRELQVETGTCDLPLLINSAKSLLYLQQLAPERLAKAATLLWYPQYWSYCLTGALGAEVTYTANHSFLFDIQRRCPSSVARALGVESLLRLPLGRPGDHLGNLHPDLQQRWGLPEMPVAVGIHDSNAALLPYLLKHPNRDFVLNSTGTWCVAMHRVPQALYREEELEQKIIFNIDALGQLHKTSFLMGGQDYALYAGMIGGNDPGFDQTRVDGHLAELGNAILPGAHPSQFPGMHGGASGHKGESRISWSLEELSGGGPEWLRQPEKAYDYLNASLAIQTTVALARTDMQAQSTVFVEGGFRNNSTYVALLAALLPEASVVLTDLSQATAAGTALLALDLVVDADLRSLASHLEIQEHHVPAPRLEHLAAYSEDYLRLARPSQR